MRLGSRLGAGRAGDHYPLRYVYDVDKLVALCSGGMGAVWCGQLLYGVRNEPALAMVAPGGARQVNKKNSGRFVIRRSSLSPQKYLARRVPDTICSLESLV